MAQSAARGSHNPKVVSSSLTGRNFFVTAERCRVASVISGQRAQPRLLVRREGEWRIIWSSRGGKQGDTAMPAFFSLAMHPAIADIAKKFGVRVFAYLDDISTGCSSRSPSS
jgi:hypothetical protein